MKSNFRLLPSLRPCLALGLAVGTLAAASAGTFKRIAIDGSFADWAGVPVAVLDDEGDMVDGTLAGFDLREVYVANDDEYLYLRVVIHPSSTNSNYGDFHHHFFIDSDNDPGTGRAAFGLGVEMMVEDAGGYSERYGTFNDGALTGMDWAQAPAGALPTFQYEARISRAVRDTQPEDVPVGSGNPERDLPVFTQDAIAIAFEVLDSNWALADAGTTFTYELAALPPVFSGTETLIGLSTTPWQVNDAGTDLGSDWLAADYDDTQAGWQSGPGLFGFNAPAGVYPAPVNTSLASGASAYYWRTHFAWDSDQTGVGLLISNYLSGGAVFYLNGAEAKRVRMPEGLVTFDTPATGGPTQPGVAELFDLPTASLVVGDNVLEVEVHLAAGATSSLVFGASLTASDNFPPRLEDATQPADRTVIEGQATTFDPGTLAGTQPFTYQWYKDGTLIDGATGATLTLDPVTEADAGGYSLEIANPKDLKVTSRAAALTTTAVPVALANPALPADQTVAEGTTATFAVDATGTLPTYQWYREGEPMAGEVGAELILNDVPLSEQGKRYSVTVSNRLGSVPSRQATLSVVRDMTAPGITRVAGGGRSVAVTFSEPLDPASAGQASNYSLDGGAQVQGAALDAADGRTVTLTTSPQNFGQAYRVSVNGVKDRFGNAATTTALFRSTIVIDEGFADWDGVPVALTQEELAPGTVEFKELSITNDNDYLYLRFSFYVPVGPLGPADWNARGNHYDIIFDTDQDPATGTWSGGDVLIEDGGVYRLAGGWTEGIYQGGDIGIAPAETKATDFELRFSRRATHQTDGLPAFPNPSINVFLVIQSTGWAALDQTTPAIPYTFVDFPPLPVAPGPLSVRLVGPKVELTWPGGGVLETRPSLSAGSWTTVPGAASGFQVDSASATAGYYRLRQE